MEFRLLGPLEVRENGRELSLGGAKQRALLALLLLRANELVATERIVDELWGDQPPPTATKTVQVYVSQLRKALGRELLETRGPGYVLRAAREAVDLNRFEDDLAEGRRLLGEADAPGSRRALDRALGLWRGSALADFRYEPFAQNEIARLEELRLAALELRLEARLALGENTEAVPELEALVRDHPLRESLRRLLMLALYRGGRQADALGAYQDARAALVEGLGLEPSPTLQALEKAILQQDESLDLPRPEPAPVSPAPRPAAPGAASTVSCSSCGADNGAGARFCHACGAALVLDLPSEARKVVTVLFCDVVASTELAERLDPESLRALLARFFDLASTVLDRHGGTVEKFVGDAVLAVFGVPVVREDDALRAVRAAAELRATVAARVPELRVRIGVNTGEVVAGDANGGGSYVTGESVNIGKRLEEVAEPGSILLGAETYALVEHAVDGVRLEPVALKGSSTPQAPFGLETVDPEAPAFLRRDDAPLVGRAAELARLRAVYDEVAAGHGAKLVTVVGDAGIGKSRLVRELLAGIGPAATVVIGRSAPYGEGVTFLPLRELLRRGGREEAELGSSSHAIFAAVRQLVEELAAERPLVACFEDVHWAEPTFLDLVEYLQGRLGTTRVLLVCLARPELAELRSNLLHDPAVAIAVQPLSRPECAQLLDGLGAPEEVRQRIAEAAEGNPLFVEQLAVLAEDQAPLPASIRGVLAERLDRLSREDRAVLERGAVAGRSFSVESVIELCPPELRGQVHARLLSLERVRLLRADTELADGFRFQHALIRDAAYDGIPKRTRAELHERMAALVADDALAGFHLEQSFRFHEQLGAAEVVRELAVRAGRLLRSAGRSTSARSDLPAAISYLDRANALLPEEDETRALLLNELGSALVKTGDYGRAQEVLAAAIATAAARRDRIAELRARVDLQFARSFATGNAAAAENVRVAEEVMPELERLGDDLGLARAWWLKGEAAAWGCLWLQRAEALTRALEHARRGNAGADDVGMISGQLAQALLFGPTPVDEAIAQCEGLLADSGGDRALRAGVGTSLAGLLAMQGSFEEARGLWADASSIYEEFGLRLRRALWTGVAYQIELLAADPAAAERELRGAIATLEEFGARPTAVTFEAELAHVLFLLGRTDDAEALCRKVAEGAAEDDLAPQVRWRTTLARILVARGDLDEAGPLIADGLRITETFEFPDWRVAALVAAGDAEAARGRAREARRRLTDARALMAAKGNAVTVQELDAALLAHA